MKRNVKFFTLVIALLLLSSLVLTGGMYTVSENRGETKSYNLIGLENTAAEENRGDSGSILEDAPTAQAPLHGKFGEYLHAEGSTVTVFSPEQYSTLNAVRESGGRTPLTHEEILFLVNDSINLYYAYDEIWLTNAIVGNCLPATLMFAALQSSSSCLIRPYHGDYSEFGDYQRALETYDRVIEEIYAIIYYRIYMHDAGFAKIFRSFDDVILPSEWEVFYEEHEKISSNWLTNIYQLLPLDGSAVGGVENGDKIALEFQKVVSWKQEFLTNSLVDVELQSLDFPLFGTEIFHDQRTSMEHCFYLYDRDSSVQIVYPTKELTARKPQLKVLYQGEKSDAPQPVVWLNYANKKASISAGLEFSFAMSGEFEYHDEVLKVYIGEKEDPTYCYVFFAKDGQFVYSASNSKPPENAGFNWEDGLVFKQLLEIPSVEPEITQPPLREDETTDITEEEPAAFKIDLGSNFCSLMLQGNSVLDGTYSRDENAVAFFFKDREELYQYVFYACGDGIFEYAKGESNAYAEYQYEDGTRFSFCDDCTVSCYFSIDNALSE